MTMRIDLAGRSAIVTGSTSGIGLAIARRLLRSGASVVVNSRDQGRADAVAAQLADEFAGEGGEVVGVGADVAESGGAARLVEAVVAGYGGLDLLVNNAGIPLVRPAEDITEDEWTKVLATNLTGPFLCAQAAARVMFGRGGVIVNVSSILGLTSIPGRTAYSTAKHGLDGLTQALAVEWARHGIRVVSVNPGYVATPLVQHTMADGNYSASDIQRRTPLGRLATPEEIADMVVLLASPAAAYVTGAQIPVDGGWLAYGGW